MASTQFVITFADPAAWLGWSFCGRPADPDCEGVCVAVDGSCAILRDRTGRHHAVPMVDARKLNTPRAEWAIHLDTSEPA